jgi:cytochrome c553
MSGRDDGLTWSTPNGPRRTKSLAAALGDSAPYSWDGARRSLRDQVTNTFERLAGQGGLRSGDLDALVAYVSSLPAPPRTEPERDPGQIERGRQLFASREAACATCHRGPGSTDNARHDVTSSVDADVTARFDTPSLRFLEGRAPYFHDGRYPTLSALLHGSDGTMGHTGHLSDQDIEALEAFLETL